MTSPARTTPRPRIAVVEDEHDLRDAVVDYLVASGYQTWGTDSAEAAYRRLVVEPVDIVLLDLGLPGEDGYSACRHLRQIPTLGVIVISAHDTVEDRVRAIECGADIYLQKPAAMREIVANIEALSRRLSQAPMPSPPQATTPGWRLNPVDWVLLSPERRAISLSAQEFKFLQCLVMVGCNAQVSKREIADSLWGNHLSVDFARIDVLLTRLRRKCLEEGGQPLPVKTVTAYGYLLTAPCHME